MASVGIHRKRHTQLERRAGKLCHRQSRRDGTKALSRSFASLGSGLPVGGRRRPLWHLPSYLVWRIGSGQFRPRKNARLLISRRSSGNESRRKHLPLPAWASEAERDALTA